MRERSNARRRWLALLVLCSGFLMTILDSTVVNVALPSIRSDLGFSATSLVWVVNAYVVTSGGFLLLGGRLGDLYGGRRLFLTGIIVFTVASAACGSATSQDVLVWSRAFQGLGGAIVEAVSFSLIINMFTEPRERAKAMGIYGCICSVGGCLGVLLGGVITSSLNWHWIFLINLPFGVLVYALCMWLVPATRQDDTGGSHFSTGRLDILGAITVTASLMLAVYAIVNGSETGWSSKRFLATILVSVVLMMLFLIIEACVRNPLVPPRLFRSRALTVANMAAAFWGAALFAWFFLCALYLQRMLGKNAMEIGIAFLPTNLVVSVLSLGFSARLVSRFGIRISFVAGFFLAALGLALFAVTPLKPDMLKDILPGMILFGAGAGVAFNPLMLSAVSGVESKDSGLASGLINTSTMMGGALGIAVLASVASAWMGKLSLAGADAAAALNGAYHVAFAMCAVFAFTAAILGIVLLPAGAEGKLPSQESAASGL